ncbi:hypothetical protein ABIA33_000667 [Streptacidiphilus sp. MAP12-16]|uniref:hypothetical protein n=1 Tax=Streptacidiphilus sp. MAP12-16 TaxID=3156300 RepID=UPI003510E933
MRRILTLTLTLTLASVACLTLTGCASNAGASSAAESPAPGTAQLAPAANRTNAATTLRSNDEHYRALLAEGEAAWGNPSFRAWQQKAALDLTYQQAYTTADQNFHASDEPPSIGTWREDISTASQAINDWAGQYAPATSDRAHMPPPTAVTTAIDKADRDANDVAAGK